MLTQMTASCRHSIAYDTRFGGFKPDKVDFSAKIKTPNLSIYTKNYFVHEKHQKHEKFPKRCQTVNRHSNG
jgi:hypothetical protein